MIVIGSKALCQFFMDSQREQKSDYDVVMTPVEFQGWATEYAPYIKSLLPRSSNKFKATVTLNGNRKQYEIELGLPGTSAELLLTNVQEVSSGSIDGFLGDKMYILNLYYQYLTKRSHVMFPVHFEKNMADYHLLRSHLGTFKRDDLMKAYYKLRRVEADERYSKFKTPKLDMVTVEDFFSSKLAVPTYFVHDHIHEAMKHHDVPVFAMMQPDPTIVACSKEQFMALPYDYRIQAVQEEAYVIALERYMLPHQGDDWYNPFEAYKKAVKRICTTLCSGWFRDFAIENYPVVIDRCDRTFYMKLKSKYRSGEIQLKPGTTPDMLPAFV